MPSILKAGALTIAVVKVPTYAPLLAEAGRLQEQLAIALLILENLPGVSIETSSMRRVLEDSGWKA